MLKVENYAKIRRAHRDGMSIREIGRRFHHSRRKIREAIATPEPTAYTLSKPRERTKLTTQYQDQALEILESDKQAPKKQRHTAQLIFRRLQESGYLGGYAAVQRFIRSHRTRLRETFLPLHHDPGQRMEADFGQIYVDFPDGRKPVSVLILTWAHSNATFAIALPSEKTEAISHGTVLGFEYFGSVPRELWWDNPKTVATTILQGRKRILNDHYMALSSHYNFEPLFCMPARGNEKPRVEGRVKWLQRNWATPVPRVSDMAELNEHLRQCCDNDKTRTVAGKQGTIKERFVEEQENALDLPIRPFDCCIAKPRDVDKYQTVAWGNNRYSVPRRFAFTTVSVKAYVNSIVIVSNGQVIAQHDRSYSSKEMLLDPLHYLTLLETKPAYLDHTDVYRKWKLPSDFQTLRDDFEDRLGKTAGSRQFILVLQLLGSCKVEVVQKAIQQCQREGVVTAMRIIHRTQQAASTPDHSLNSFDSFTVAPTVQVPMPDLNKFDALLSRQSLACESESTLQRRRDDENVGRRPQPVTETQFETTTASNDIGRA